MAPKGASSKKASSQPPPEEPGPAPEWMQHQAARLDAASKVYSGLTAAEVDDVYPILYTSGAREAISIAKKMVEREEAGQPSQGQSSQPGQSSASSQPGEEWVREARDADVDLRTHHEANLMQNRIGEDSPSLFNPARHTVVIAGRPVQVACDCHVVMSTQPCADNQSFTNLVVFLSFPGRSRCLASLLLPGHVEMSSFL